MREEAAAVAAAPVSPTPTQTSEASEGDKGEQDGRESDSREGELETAREAQVLVLVDHQGEALDGEGGPLSLNGGTLNTSGPMSGSGQRILVQAAAGEVENPILLEKMWDDDASTISESGVIFPNNKALLGWDLFMLLQICFVAVYVPFQVGVSAGVLVYTSGYGWLGFAFINLCFITDTVLNFFRASFDKRGRIVIDRKRIAIMYLRGWFTIDVISCIPVDPLLRFVQTDGTSASVMTIVNLLRLFRLGRASRIMDTNTRILVFRLRTYRPSVELLKVSAMLLLFNHWSGCFFCLVALIEAGDFSEDSLLNPDTPNWLALYALTDGELPVVGEGFQNIWARYTLSLYWAITTSTSIGYGDITPFTLEEHWYAIFVMLLSGLFWSFVLGTIIATLDEMRRPSLDFRLRLTQLNTVIDHFQVGQLTSGVAAEARLFLHKQNVRSIGVTDSVKIGEVAPVLDLLPPRLRNKCCLSLVQHDMGQSTYFRHPSIDVNTLGGIAARCEIHQFNVGEVMYVERGAKSSKRGLFIVRMGVVAVTSTEDVKGRGLKIYAGKGVIMDDYVSLPDDSPLLPEVVQLGFWTYTELLFVPRNVICGLFRLHPDVWHAVGRWR
ncbi:Potassium voltage-gated channel subfamily H member 1 (Ether-a-go-go potassium channel 1) (EAG channel 1) (EAG1) (r-eag) (Voltage-gated potassium channel subunit Kv10.1), partial [Durusdinium trenchii]